MVNGNNYTLNKIFNNVIADLIIIFPGKENEKKKIYFKFISHVKLISNNLNYLIKLVVYYLCHELFDVYEKKGIKSKKVISINSFYEILESYKLYHILSFVKGVYSSVENTLKKESSKILKFVW